MTALLTVVLAIPFILLIKAHIVVPRSTILPTDMLNNMKSELHDDTYDVTFDKYQHIARTPYVDELESLPANTLNSDEIKESNNEEEINNNNMEKEPKSVEDYPEFLPTALPLKSFERRTFSGPDYRMTICHFKICNMGRKRDTSFQKF